MYKIELFIWKNKGLEVKVYKKNSAREAMNFAYENKWDVMKVYDEDGSLMHANYSNREYETYA